MATRPDSAGSAPLPLYYSTVACMSPISRRRDCCSTDSDAQALNPGSLFPGERTGCLAMADAFAAMGDNVMHKPGSTGHYRAPLPRCTTANPESTPSAALPKRSLPVPLRPRPGAARWLEIRQSGAEPRRSVRAPPGWDHVAERVPGQQHYSHHPDFPAQRQRCGPAPIASHASWVIL